VILARPIAQTGWRVTEKTIQKMRTMRALMLADPRMLFTNAFDTPNPAVTGTSTTWMAHQNNYENERMKLANLISLAGSIPCPIPPDASVEVNIPPPAAPTFLK